MAQTAAIYARISKDREGNQLGVGRQETLCRELAEKRNLMVTAVFTDNDTSASTRSRKPRPQYAEMMRRAQNGEFSTILAYSYSRLTRRPQEFNDLIELAESHGVRIGTVASGEFDLNLASGRGVARTIAAWDAVEAEQASERIKAAKLQRATNGEWHGGTAPFGFRSANTKLVVVPKEASLVREAATRILAGDTVHAVVTDWNNKGVTTRFGHHWRNTSLRSILQNQSMLGLTKSGKKGWEAILDERTFERLQVIFGESSRKFTHSPGVKGGKYSMGGGLTVCAECGHKLITHSRVGPEGRRVLLACLKRVNGPTACGHVTIDHDVLEEYVFTQVAAGLKSNPFWYQMLSDREPEIETKITKLQANRDNILEKRRRLNDMYVDGTIDRHHHDSRIAELTNLQDNVQAQIEALLGVPMLADDIDETLNWREWPPLRRRNFLRIAIVRIEAKPWPKGRGVSLPRRRGESEEQVRERRRAYALEMMAERVTVVRKGEAHL